MKQNRDCLLTFRVTRNQMGQFTRLAAFEGVSLSRLIRTLLDKELRQALLDGFEDQEKPVVFEQKLLTTFEIGFHSPVALHGMNDRIGG